MAFAELENFIDNQVKYYSSGMYVRLGFAVAVNVDPDILVVDEVLAVGDENFQRKCMGRIKEFQNDGRTILFVTHSADLVRVICDRAVVLSSGEMLGYALGRRGREALPRPPPHPGPGVGHHRLGAGVGGPHLPAGGHHHGRSRAPGDGQPAVPPSRASP